MNPGRIKALTFYYLFAFKNDVTRVILAICHPVFDLMIWGFTTKYIIGDQIGNKGSNYLSLVVSCFIFWNIISKAQQETSSQFKEDIYCHNLNNLMITPLKSSEFILALLFSSLIKILLIIPLLFIFSLVLFNFNLFKLNPTIIIHLLNYLIFGWSLGIGVTALTLRLGNRVDFLPIILSFLIQPFACVFYPRTTLNGIFYAISWLIPPSYGFEAMRNIILNQNSIISPANSANPLIAFSLSIFYFLFSLFFYELLLQNARRKGTLIHL